MTTLLHISIKKDRAKHPEKYAFAKCVDQKSDQAQFGGVYGKPYPIPDDYEPSPQKAVEGECGC